MTLDELAKKGKKFLKNAEEQLYKGVAKIEQQIETKEGVIGGIAEVVEKAVDEGKRINQSVQDKGGYVKVAKDGLEKALNKMDGLYKNVEDKLFTDGKYDSEKGKKLLKEGTDLAEKYGTKAGKIISDMAKDVGGKVQANYREMVPSRAERETTYAGIGLQYHGLLFRQNYEDCLKFYAKAEETLPKELRSRNRVLADIKASASSNALELMKFYEQGADLKKVQSTSKYKATKEYLYRI